MEMGLLLDAEDAIGNTTDISQATPTVNNDTDVSAVVQNIVLVTCSPTSKVETLEGGVEEIHDSDVTQPILLPSSIKYIAVEYNYPTKESPRVWVRHGRSLLTIAERDMINYGKQLNDKHINYAQTVMQITLYQHIRKRTSDNPLQKYPLDHRQH